MSDFAEIKQAITAAAESVSSVANKNSSGICDEEGHFLSRLNHHSALLDENVVPSAIHQPFSFFSSPRKLQSCIEPGDGNSVKSENVENNLKSTDNIKNNIDDSQRVIIELSFSAIAKLNELFGDGQKNEEQKSTVQVALPLWMCEFLYKACQKMPIGESMQEECENCNENKNEATGQKQKKPAQSRSCQNTSVKQLYEMFPGLAKKVINQVVKENEYDFDKAAIHLMEHSDSDLNISAGGETVDGGQQYVSTFVPSHCPRIITEEEQRMNALNISSSIPISNLYNEAEQNIERDLRRLELEGKHYNELKRKLVGIKNCSILGYYTDQVRDVEARKKKLLNCRDELQILNTSSEESIDLHQMSFDRAMAVVIFKIKVCRAHHKNMRKLTVITGHGKTTGACVLKPRLLTFLKSKGISAHVSPTNMGAIEINLSTIHGNIQ